MRRPTAVLVMPVVPDATGGGDGSDSDLPLLVDSSSSESSDELSDDADKGDSGDDDEVIEGDAVQACDSHPEDDAVPVHDTAPAAM
jgi:hypothetical protein